MRKSRFIHPNIGRVMAKNKRKEALANGYKSGFEYETAKMLEKKKIKFKYESEKVSFTVPAKSRTYTPDFFLPNGIIIEAKGFFRITAQRILKAIKKQHPELDIRLVFYDCNKKVQGSNLTCKAWATKYNFKFADKAIPIEWIK